MAIAPPKRSPDIYVPTIEELGYPGFQSAAWYGVFGPAGLPDAVTRQLNAKIVAGLQKPALRKSLEALGATLVGSTPEEFGQFVRKDLADWSRVVSNNNLGIR